MNFDGIILAAGRGKRLRPLTAKIPKALAYLPGGNLLDHQLGLLRALGARRIVVVLGHLAEEVEKHLERRGPAVDREVTCVRQKGPEGLLYALEDALHEADPPLMVLHGDNFLGDHLAPFASLLACARSAIAAEPEGSPEAGPTKDTVSWRDKGRIIKFGERLGDTATGTSFGCYSLSPDIIPVIREIAGKCRADCDMIPVFTRYLNQGGTLRSVVWQAPRLNLNTETDMLGASSLILRRWPSLEYPRPDPGMYVPPNEERRLDGSTIRGPAWLSACARLEECDLGPEVAVGPGASLRRVTASRCVFFPFVDREGESIEGRLIY